MDEDKTALGRRGLVIPAPEAPIEMLRDVEFAGASGRPLRLDVHRLANAHAPVPLVWIASGYRDEGFASAVGCAFKEMQWTKSWAHLFAAAGMAAIAATNEDPAADLRAGLEMVSRRGKELGVDPSRVGIFATSGHVPTALSALMRDSSYPLDVSSAAFAYGYTLDLAGSDAVARAAASFRFANPCAGRSLEELRTDVPLLLVRAGRDEMPGLNASLDAFVAGALARNLPLTVVNHPEAPHAFDLFHDDARSRSIIREIPRFLAATLGSIPNF